ncbi:MAG: hydantoinase/oxoprolinase family protein [Candidatus Eisenbacteria bacterium]
MAPQTERTKRDAAPSADAVGLDTGGTFTDVVVQVGRTRRAFKLPSTPAAPERAVLQGLASAGAGTGTAVRHGSTVATNALLEGKLARVTFVTTEGFEDLLEIGRQDRPDLYALVPRRVPPLVPPKRRIGVRERIAAGGEVRVALSDSEVARVVKRVRATRPQAIAVGLLHAWAYPRHERRLALALAVLGVPVSVSSDLVPEIREYERFATTVANAALQPRVAGYLNAIAAGRRGRIEVVLSHGGTAPAAQAAREPVRQLLSGPAAGLRAALAAARECGFATSLTLDVGGTSTDCAFLGAGDSGEDGLPRRRGREVAGVPVLLPTLDVHTVGAGGGSIASCDAGGLLCVGPQSAGADPGPACYGRGGPATVTDAMVLLGRLPGESLAEGALTLHRECSERALTLLARQLGLKDAASAAQGVQRVADARMEAALRKVSVERGEDPRGAALVAFGGAGGLHACELAAALGARAVVWPRHAGVLCALGALEGGSRRERSRTVLRDARDTVALARTLARLEREVLARFERNDRRRVQLEPWAEVRYLGQAHELSLPALPLRGLAERFHRAHERRYGFSDSAREVHVVTLEMRGALPAALAAAAPTLTTRGRHPATRTRVFEDGVWREAMVWRRDALGRGARLAGPAVVLDSGATLWVPRGWVARLHRGGALIVTRSGPR